MRRGKGVAMRLHERRLHTASAARGPLRVGVVGLGALGSLFAAKLASSGTAPPQFALLSSALMH
jgi:phosphoglycerate dehydrogenase-like enzyme